MQDIRKQTDKLVLSVHVAAFVPTEIHLLPDQAQETDLKIRLCDRQGRSFPATVRVETKRAGLSVLFFCENVLICQTVEPLTFYYHRRAGVFERDNANQLAEPLATEPGNVVYAIESAKELFVAAQGSSQCSRLVIGAGSVFKAANTRQFNYASETSLCSVCKLLLMYSGLGTNQHPRDYSGPSVHRLQPYSLEAALYSAKRMPCNLLAESSRTPAIPLGRHAIAATALIQARSGASLVLSWV